MSDETNWDATIEEFDIEAALKRSRIVWLKLALAFDAWANDSAEFLDTAKQVNQAIGYAARAEACYLQASGEGDGWAVKDFLESGNA